MEDSLFYNKDYKEAMQLHIATLKTIPEDILVDMIEMLNLNRYQTYVSMIQHNDPANKFQHIAKSNELKWTLKAIDRFKDQLVQWLPQSIDNTDPLTGIDQDTLMKDLKKDFEHRQQFMTDLVKKYSWQMQEKEQDNKQI